MDVQHLERLESRRYLHTATLVDGVLFIFASAVNDSLEFATGRSQITLYPKENGVAERTETWRIRDLSRIVIDVGPGDDVVILGRVPIRADIKGNRGNDLLMGGWGDDTIRGDAGNDTLFGSQGKDLLDGGGGADDISGGASRDTADYSNRVASVRVTLGVVADDGEAGEGDNVRTNIEGVLGGSAGDTFSTTSGLRVIFFGNAGNDTLIGGGGDDQLIGGPGRDLLVGNAGNDLIIANDDNRGRPPFEIDTIQGGSGSNDIRRDSIDILA